MEIEAKVLALVYDYHLAKIETADGNQYSITDHTEGVDWAELKEGQKVFCVIDSKLPRVLKARI